MIAPHLHPPDDDALEQHQVERDARDLARREPEHDEATPPLRGPQRLLRVGTADRVDHDVGGTAGELLGPHLEVLGACSRCPRPRRTSGTARAWPGSTPRRSRARPSASPARPTPAPRRRRRRARARSPPPAGRRSCAACGMAVVCATLNAAASRRSTESGTTVTELLEFTTIFSAYAPTKLAPYTWSPTATSPTPSPSALDHPGELASRARTAPAAAPGTRWRRSARRGSSPPRRRCRRGPRRDRAPDPGPPRTTTDSGRTVLEHPCGAHRYRP